MPNLSRFLLRVVGWCLTNFVCTRTLASLLLGAVLSGCASSPVVYNPEKLSPSDAHYVANICESVMGFRPTAAEVTNAWPGDPDPAAATNSYRGCIASISQSLVRKADQQREDDGENACLSRSLPQGTPQFSECVLRYLETVPVRTDRIATPDPAVGSVSAAFKPDTSAPGLASREQHACAAIGLDPEDLEFQECVNSLADVVTARALNQAYTN